MKGARSLLPAQAYQREGCDRLTISISLGVQVSALQLYRLLLSHKKVAISRVLSFVSVRGFPCAILCDAWSDGLLPFFVSRAPQTPARGVL